MPHSFLPNKGNFRDLIAFQKAECVYDITFYFAKKYLTKRDRTIDQMIQAARSCKQNIATPIATPKIKNRALNQFLLRSLSLLLEDIKAIEDIAPQLNIVNPLVLSCLIRNILFIGTSIKIYH